MPTGQHVQAGGCVAACLLTSMSACLLSDVSCCLIVYFCLQEHKVWVEDASQPEGGSWQYDYAITNVEYTGACEPCSTPTIPMLFCSRQHCRHTAMSCPCLPRSPALHS